MKKFIAIILSVILLLSSVFVLSSCNKKIIDFTYAFDYAYIYDTNGGIVKEGYVKNWDDYDGEQLQVTFKDGEIWLTSSFRCDLIQH